MAHIIGALGLSHTPTIGFAFDKQKQSDPAWAPIFEAFVKPAKWLAEQSPDALIVIYNDHVTSFFLDHYSAFSLGVGTSYHCADEGGGARDLPMLHGQPLLAAHIGESLMAEEFDMSFFQGRPLDHGIYSPLSMLLGSGASDPVPPLPDGSSPQSSWVKQPSSAESLAWSIPIIPLQIGVLQFPMPTANRCLKLGRALRRAVESFPADMRVAIIATGGLSHQVHGERAGFNNMAWDHEFLELIENDPERLAQLTQAELAKLGGMEGSEVIMWLVMRGALSAGIKKIAQSYYLPSMTGIATVIYENKAAREVAGENERQRELQAMQLKGSEKLAGSYPYTLQRSVQAFRLNQYLHRMTLPSHRQAFLNHEESSFSEAMLVEQEKILLRARDWRGLIHYGVIFFVLEKWAAVLGVSNLHVYAAMRGESLEDFQRSRNAPTAIYSVAAHSQVSLNVKPS
jgi:gallate dioxygenase